MKWNVFYLVVGIICGFVLSAFLISQPAHLAAWIFGRPAPPASQPSSQNPTPPPADLARNFQVELDALKEKLDRYDKRADDLQRLLTILVGFSTIYAAALALNALKEAKESQEKLSKLETELTAEAQKTRDELLGTFPLFSRMSKNFETTVRTMLDILPTVDKSAPCYRDPSSAERELVLFYEKAFAAAEYFDLKHFSKDVARIYQGLGNFYAISARNSETLSEKTTDLIEKARHHQAYKDCLERARFYLERAVKTDPRNTGALNDRAYLELVIARPPEQDLKVARHYCERSLEEDGKQQRARFNLGWLKLVHEPKDYNGSVELFRAAKDMPNWQQTEPARRVAEILYNKACALVGAARESDVPAVQTKHLSEAMNDLKEAFQQRDKDNELIIRDAFCTTDTKPGGDLAFLKDHPDFAQRFETLFGDVCKPAN